MEGNPIYSKCHSFNNIQLKTSPKLTRDLSSPEQLDKFRAHIECQQPTMDLYQFIGILTVYGGQNGVKTTHLGLENLLPRGARLKNTKFVYGKAIHSFRKKMRIFTINLSLFECLLL